MLRNTVESVRSRCQREIGSFADKVAEHGVGEAEVAFGVFKVDRIDLVRHGRGTDFAGDRFLLEIAQRDIAHRSRQRSIRMVLKRLDGIEQFGHVIVRLDLDGVGIPVSGPAIRRSPGRRPASRLSG